MKVISSASEPIPYAHYKRGRERGWLSLGIDNSVAVAIVSDDSEAPISRATRAAFHFWNWIALGAPVVGIYLAFTQAWWWAIIGLVANRAIWAANKSSASQAVLSAADSDQSFYERISGSGAWIYRIDDERLAQDDNQ